MEYGEGGHQAARIDYALFLASGWTWGFCCKQPPFAPAIYFLGPVGLGDAKNAVQLNLSPEGSERPREKALDKELAYPASGGANSNRRPFLALEVNWSLFSAERQVQLDRVFSSSPHEVDEGSILRGS